LYWRSGSYLAVRSGDWKLQRTENPARSRLFNLAIDPTEQHDLAAAEPVRRANMEAQLQRFNAAKPNRCGPHCWRRRLLSTTL
jgi:arylsulfatase A-like enzyme